MKHLGNITEIRGERVAVAVTKKRIGGEDDAEIH